MIKNCYGTTIRPTTVFFKTLLFLKWHHISKLCCHISALIIFLKHFTETKEKILKLTGTEQVQKWHQAPKNGYIPKGPNLIN